MAALPVAEPYWKQAMPAAYNPAAFGSLSPEQQEAEKKKAGCCATCCCCCCGILLALIFVLGLGAAIAGACLTNNCLYETANPDATRNTFPVDDYSAATADFEAVTVYVNRGDLVVSGSADGLVATSETLSYDDAAEINEKNTFAIEEIDSVNTVESIYHKSGSGVDDCKFCRDSFVTVAIPAGKAIDCTTLVAPITVNGDATIQATDINLSSLSGGISVTADITATGDVRVATDANSVEITSDITGNDIEVFGAELTVGASLDAANVYVRGATALNLEGATLGGANVTINSFRGFSGIPTLAATDFTLLAQVGSTPNTITGLGETSFTNAFIDADEGSDVTLGMTCQGRQVNVTVEYAAANNQDPRVVPSLVSNIAGAVWTFSNDTSGSVRDLYYANYLACSGAAGETQTLEVDLTSNVGTGSFEITFDEQ